MKTTITTSSAEQKTQGVPASEGSTATGSELAGIYRHRFDGKQAYRDQVWQEILRGCLQQIVGDNKVVLDLGCGWGEFSRNVSASRLLCMDLNPDSRNYLPEHAEFIEQDCSLEWAIQPNSLDVVFTSNFFEHLPSKDLLANTLEHAALALKPGGKIICLGPNIACLPGKYWDFWDHHIALSDHSLAEILSLSGFDVQQQTAKFLPYTMSTGIQVPAVFIKAYLKLPLFWPLVGKQFLLVAELNDKNN